MFKLDSLVFYYVASNLFMSKFKIDVSLVEASCILPRLITVCKIYYHYPE